MTDLTRDALRSAIIAALLDIAPDVDATGIDPATPFREQFDFDSMDHLNFAIALHRRLAVDVPETDYAELATLDGCMRYLSRALGLSNP